MNNKIVFKDRQDSCVVSLGNVIVIFGKCSCD